MSLLLTDHPRNGKSRSTMIRKKQRQEIFPLPINPRKGYKSTHDESPRDKQCGAASLATPTMTMMQHPTPLDILLSTMRRKWSEGDHDSATAIAKLIAPYVHGHRTATAKPSNTPTELYRLTDDDLAIRLAAARPGATGTSDNSHESD